MIRRREFITLLGGATLVADRGAAQQKTMPVIGFLNSVSAEGFTERLRSVRQGLKQNGLCRGREHCDRVPLG